MYLQLTHSLSSFDVFGYVKLFVARFSVGRGAPGRTDHQPDSCVAESSVDQSAANVVTDCNVSDDAIHISESVLNFGDGSEGTTRGRDGPLSHH